jgi:hypothetical protein
LLAATASVGEFQLNHAATYEKVGTARPTTHHHIPESLLLLQRRWQVMKSRKEVFRQS